MEPMNSLENADIESGSTVPLSPSGYVPPTLRERECYHVFVSYSSTDHLWTHSLINQLESCGLQVCYHERDFTPGRTVLENMSECIQESQKVLLLLSPEFVRSRWCLLEANMSMFRDCLERKPMVPVLLDPRVTVPLHLCHLTYLEAGDPKFMDKLLKVLCTPNQQLQGSTVVPFQPPSIYNGKALQPLTAVNEESLYKWDSGQFSDMAVPDQLRLIIEDPQKYRDAVRIINNVSQSKMWLHSLWIRVLIYVAAMIFCLAIASLFAFLTAMLAAYDFPDILPDSLREAVFTCFWCVPVGWIIHISLWKRDDETYILREMQKAIGEANALLCVDKVLMGCQSNSKIYLVYVSLEACRCQFNEAFSGQASADYLFKRALIYFSSSYACCLAKKHFPFPVPSSTGHLEGGVCFCQYVSQKLEMGQWL